MHLLNDRIQKVESPLLRYAEKYPTLLKILVLYTFLSLHCALIIFILLFIMQILKGLILFQAKNILNTTLIEMNFYGKLLEGNGKVLDCILLEVGVLPGVYIYIFQPPYSTKKSFLPNVFGNRMIQTNHPYPPPRCTCEGKWYTSTSAFLQNYFFVIACANLNQIYQIYYILHFGFRDNGKTVTK